MLIVTALWGITVFVDFNFYKKSIQAIAMAKYKLAIEIDGGIVAELFPEPRLSIQKVQINYGDHGIVKSGDITIYPSISSLASLDFITAVRKVGLRDAELDSTELVKYLRSEFINERDALLTNIVMQDVSLSYKDSSFRVLEMDGSYSRIGFDKYNYNISSVILLGSIKYDITSELIGIAEDFSNISKATFSLNNKNFSFVVDGKINNILDDMELRGNALLSIKNLRAFMRDMPDSIPHVHASYNADYHADIIQNMWQDVSISFSSNVSFERQVLQFFDVVTATEGIENFCANVIIDTSSDSEIEVLLRSTTDTIDMSKFINKDKMTDVDDIFSSLTTYFKNDFELEIMSDLAIFIDCEIKKLVLDGGDVIDVVFSGDIVNSNVFIRQLAAGLPGNGRMELSGFTSHNSIRPKFDGTLTISIKDLTIFNEWLANKDGNTDKSFSKPMQFKTFLLKTQLSIIPHRIRLLNMRMAFDDLLLMGKVTLVRNGLEKIGIGAVVRFNEMNLDKFGLSNVVDDFIFTLYRSDSDKSGNTYFQLVNDYRWLRYLHFTLNIDFLADRLIFKGKQFNKAFASLELTPGAILISHMHAATDGLDFQGNFHLTVSGFRPNIKLVLNCDYLNTHILYEILPTISSMRKRMLNLDDTIIASEQEESPEGQFNFFSMHNFDGSINLAINTLLHNGTTLERVALNAELDNGVMNINSARAKLYKGDLSAVGSIVSVELIPQFTMGFAFNNLDPVAFLTDLIDVNSLKGYISMNGSLSSSGSNWETVKRKLQGNIKVVGRNLIWRGFDLDEIIRVPVLNLSADDKVLRLQYYTQHGNSFFSTMNGRIELASGLASLNNIELSNNRAQGIFVARYDLINKLVSAAAKFSFIPVGYTTPIIIQLQSSGNVQNPTTIFNTQQLTNFIYGGVRQSATPPEAGLQQDPAALRIPNTSMKQ